MLIGDIVRRVRNTAGDVAVNQFSNETLNDWINTAIRECVSENSLLQVTAESSTVVNQSEYSLPVNIFKLHSITVNDTNVRVTTLQEWQQKFDLDPETSTDNGIPHTAYVWAKKVRLYPAPDSIVPLKIYYTADPGDIVYDNDPDEVAWLATDLSTSLPLTYHDRIVTYCLAQVALQDDDHNKYSVLIQEFKTGVIDTKHQNETQEDLYPFMSVSNRDSGNTWEYDSW